MKGRIPFDACPLCGGDHDHLRDEPCAEKAMWKPCIDEVMRWRRCKDCGHVFAEGHFTPEAAADIFADAVDCQRVGFNIEDQRLISGALLDWVGGTGTLLDVGFGSGSLMFTADEMGWHVAGIDLRAENVDAMQKLGYDARQCELESVADEFDLICMLDVLEHMPDPKAALKHARKIGTGLLLSLPNMGSLCARYLTGSGENPYWREIEHYHNFTRERLYALLRECGWEPMRCRISERYRLGLEVLCT